MADGLTPERVEQAMARPGVGDELHALGVRNVSGFNATGSSEFLWPPESEARILELVDAALEDDEPPTEPTEPREATTSGVIVPFALAEEAARLHVYDGLGRRKLERELPGLGEWAASVIVYWYKVGHPAGLWLDADDRLCWGLAITPISGREQDREQRGKAIAPTPVALSLPRPLKAA